MSSPPVQQPLAAFHERPDYALVHRCCGLTPDGRLVRILDWARTEYWGERVVDVQEIDPTGAVRSPHVERTRESALTPVDLSFADWREQASAWRAARAAAALENALPESPPPRPLPRL